MVVRPGDRVEIRERPWRVAAARALPDEQLYLTLHALDDEQPIAVEVVSPPEEVTQLAPEDLRLALTGFDSFASWSRAHRIVAATAVQETGMLSGARFGRVALEAYQVAPTLRLLAKPRPSLLIADDVGLGKTIEAGLAILELMARRRAKRVLIVAPPGLVLQWQDELRNKFGLDFTVIENASGLAHAQTDLPAGISPWDAIPRVLTSLDYLKKETVHRRALATRWDLAVVDEAHALAESGTPQNPYSTQRTRLGRALRDASRGLLLLTATPHNGHAHSFRSLVELVEPTLATLHGDPEQVHRRVASAMIRRMKAQITRRTPIGGEEPSFPERHVHGIPVDSRGGYGEVLKKVSAYCSRTARDAANADDSELIGFAMQIVKKRALSSRRALERTVEHRLEALKKEAAREAAPERSELRDLQLDLPLRESESERISRRLLRSAIPADERRRKSEIKKLGEIRKLLKSTPPDDPKVAALLGEIRAVLAADAHEKVIVFTEYVDTLESLIEEFEKTEDLKGRWAVLRGGLFPRTRRRRQAAFESEGVAVLLATDAASEGLNLQRRCRRVVHFELPWNPNRLEQRNGRVDRYGQRRNPEIRYLFHRDSPEEHVLDVLVGKIERMRKDRVSTPDVLGVVAGVGEFEAGLVELDAEEPDVAERAKRLVRHFEDRTSEFVRDVKPLLAIPGMSVEERNGLFDLLNRSDPLLGDDTALERLAVDLLGPAIQSSGSDGVYRVEVPLSLRGPGVPPIYPRVTFRRSTAAAATPEEVEYVTPIHPLVQAIANEAHRRLLQVFADQRGLPPRRLAVRRAPPGEPASVLFTFFGAVKGGGDLIEERILTVRLDAEGRIVGDEPGNGSFLQEVRGVGEARPERAMGVFGEAFDGLTRRATEEAGRILRERSEQLRHRRAEQVALFRRELDVDLEDRLAEIADLERRARGLVDEKGQGRLFAVEDRAASGFTARRAVAESLARQRAEELDVAGDLAIVAGTAAATVHPDGDEVVEDHDEEDEDSDDEETDGEDSDDAGKGLSKGATARLVRRIEPGTFHFVPGAGRKGSGSFYTPLALVEDVVRHALGSLTEEKSAAEIERLRVVDPACGSGHFLIEAMRFMGRALHRAYSAEYGAVGPSEFRSKSESRRGWDEDWTASDAEARAANSEARAWCKRRIAERCLFGVDRNPTAVDLARVALWIESLAGDRPLTYFAHHVRHGNSLLGSWLARLHQPPLPELKLGPKRDGTGGLFEHEVLRKHVREAAEIRLRIDRTPADALRAEGIEPESVREIAFKEEQRRRADELLAAARLLFDLRTAAAFVPAIWKSWSVLASFAGDHARLHRVAHEQTWWGDFDAVRRDEPFFHWELEFPEVFLDAERGGFDGVLGNPPWDKVLPAKTEFYAKADVLIRAFKGNELDQRIRELHAAEPALKDGFEAYRRRTTTIAQLLRKGGDFPHSEARSQAAHEDLSKYFVDRAARVAGRSGAVGMVVPSVLYNGDGCVGIRRFLLREAAIERFYGFENHGKRFFPIDSRYKFVSLVFRKGRSADGFDAAFMRRDMAELTSDGPKPWMVRITPEEIEALSPETLAFLEYRSSRDQAIAHRMHEGRPTLGGEGRGHGTSGS